MADNCVDPNVCFLRLKIIEDKVDQIVYALEGNGKDGLRTRIALLEQSNNSKSKLLWLISASIITVTMFQIFGVIP
jgi:hypothetical protein